MVKHLLFVFLPEANFPRVLSLPACVYVSGCRCVYVLRVKPEIVCAITHHPSSYEHQIGIIGAKHMG